MADGANTGELRTLEHLTLADLESIRLLLRGESIIDWYRLDLEDEDAAAEIVSAQELRLDDAADLARIESVKGSAISYLRRNFDFPIPKPVAQLDLVGLLLLASSKGHRQLCACTILKVMHIIHHLEARELLFMLPVSDQEVFHLVEEKVYRVIGAMLARGFPILEFIGGRKNKDSLYTKLLSKEEVLAAQIYDKVRFRIVVRTPDDVFPTLNWLMRYVFPFNYVIPGQSTNTLFQLGAYCAAHPHLAGLARRLQSPLEVEEQRGRVDNRFTASSYRVSHFVADMPVRLPKEVLAQVPPAGWPLGPVVFAQAEFQVIDRETEHANELGEASHSAYKHRQKLAVMRRLKLGTQATRGHVEEDTPRPLPTPEALNTTTTTRGASRKRRVTKPPT